MKIVIFFICLFVLLAALPKSKKGRNGNRKANCGCLDVIKGYEFCATLQLRTPWRYLNMHQMVHKGPESKLPKIPQEHGGWLPKAKSWAELGISGLREIPEGTMASDVGQIPVNGGEYLEFLKDFRRIVESDTPPEEKRQQILALKNTSDSYAKIIGTHKDLRNEVIDKWCGYEKLLGLPDFDPKLSRNLWDAGFRSKCDIERATITQLMKVPGIGKVRAAKLKQCL